MRTKHKDPPTSEGMYPLLISGEGLIRFVGTISKGSGFGGRETYRRRIRRHPVWKLGQFRLRDMNGQDRWNVENMRRLALRFRDDYPSPKELIAKYAVLNTPVPPIVVGLNGAIIDGFHRVGAGLLRGDLAIPAYFPRKPQK
jgi:hypothetical protein